MKKHNMRANPDPMERAPGAIADLRRSLDRVEAAVCDSYRGGPAAASAAGWDRMESGASNGFRTRDLQSHNLAL